MLRLLVFPFSTFLGLNYWGKDLAASSSSSNIAMLSIMSLFERDESEEDKDCATWYALLENREIKSFQFKCLWDWYMIYLTNGNRTCTVSKNVGRNVILAGRIFWRHIIEYCVLHTYCRRHNWKLQVTLVLQDTNFIVSLEWCMLW